MDYYVVWSCDSRSTELRFSRIYEVVPISPLMLKFIDQESNEEFSYQTNLFDDLRLVLQPYNLMHEGKRIYKIMVHTDRNYHTDYEHFTPEELYDIENRRSKRRFWCNYKTLLLMDVNYLKLIQNSNSIEEFNRYYKSSMLFHPIKEYFKDAATESKSCAKPIKEYLKDVDISMIKDIVPTTQQLSDIANIASIEAAMLEKKVFINERDMYNHRKTKFYPYENYEWDITRKKRTCYIRNMKLTNEISFYFKGRGNFERSYPTLADVPSDRFDLGGLYITNSVGMGKTLVCLALMCQDYKDKSQLVLVPNRLLVQWKDNLAKYTNLEVICIQNVPQFKKYSKDFKRGVVYLMNYNVMGSEHYVGMSIFANEWDRVFMDEIHEIYNTHEEKMRKAGQDIINCNRPGCFRVLITATPMIGWNHNFIASLLLNNYNSDAFMMKYFTDRKGFYDWVAKFMYESIPIRIDNAVATIADVRSDKELNIFPDPLITKHQLEFSHVEDYIYLRMRPESYKNNVCQNIEYINESNQNHLDWKIEDFKIHGCKCVPDFELPCGHKVCSKGINSMFLHSIDKHAYCPFCKTEYKPPYPRHYGTKLYHVFKRVAEIMAISGSRLIISCSKNKLLKLISSELKEQGHDNGILEGTVFRINKIVSAFKAGETRILMVNKDSQSSGLELKEASHILILDADNNRFLDAEKQLIGRACRTGQTKQIVVDILVIKKSLEDSRRKY